MVRKDTRKYQGLWDPRAPRPHMRGPRPNAWVSGTDLELHKKYRAFIQQRNQANFRGESWQLTFEQWQELWGELWHQRGRDQGCYCMTRDQWDKPWDTTNSIIITRSEHNRRQQATANQKRKLGVLPPKRSLKGIPKRKKPK